MGKNQGKAKENSLLCPSGAQFIASLETLIRIMESQVQKLSIRPKGGLVLHMFVSNSAVLFGALEHNNCISSKGSIHLILKATGSHSAMH